MQREPLTKFFETHFTSAELRRFVKHAYPDLHTDLPGEIVSVAALADDLVSLLDRHREIDSELAAHILNARPRLATEVNTILENSATNGEAPRPHGTTRLRAAPKDSKQQPPSSDENAVPRIHFSDFFDLAPKALDDYGALNISLVNDLPLFIDPFLLFDSANPTYAKLHDEIIRYVKFLRDISTDTSIAAVLKEDWFRFPEVKQNWLGFSKTGNKGTGLGRKFANTLEKNLASAFRSFGEETISKGSHLEKICLLKDGVGRDHLSDFVANLTKNFLLEYTQTFARKHILSIRRRHFAVRKVRFDYTVRKWMDDRYELPVHDNDFVLLTPRDILTRDDAWINRQDLLDGFLDIYTAIPDRQLRDRVNHYFYERLSDKATKAERRAAADATISAFPAVLDHYVRIKEEHGDDAHRDSFAKVQATEGWFIAGIKDLVTNHLIDTSFYQAGSGFDVCLARVEILKSVIENEGGYRVFYFNRLPLGRESDLRLIIRLIWSAKVSAAKPSESGVEPRAGDPKLVEFKLASNPRLEAYLRTRSPTNHGLILRERSK